MNPFFFGSSQKYLYGAHDPPRAKATRPAGVVLCAPMGHEYMRTHKALRQLALQLSKGGHHVLRFDYFGTGDSAGEGVEGSIEQWQDDIGTAADELKETGGVSKLVLVGLRLGASLAAGVAARRADVETLVLWDPIVSGTAYLGELREVARERSDGADASAPLPVDGEPLSVGGFPLTATLAAGLERLDLTAFTTLPVRRLLTIVSEEDEAVGRLRDHLSRIAAASYRHVPSKASWKRGDEFGAMVLPQRVIQGITEYLTVETGS